jgi:hypothetical protein
MTRTLAPILAALAVAFGAGVDAGTSPPSAPVADVERHHYSISARVRPLLLFWISRSDVGDAIVTRRRGSSGAAYSLLIGSDPDRAPRRINRWGYIDEETRGAQATLVGLMTESDEESVERAEASIQRQSSGDRVFKIIRATIDGDEATSIVTAVAAPASYSFRQVNAVLALAQRQPVEGSEARTRVIHLPPGTRPGFLAALSEVMHEHVAQWRASGRVQPGGSLTYVYHGRLYELRATRARPVANVHVGASSFASAITSDFETRSTYDGEVTRFSMTYGAEGPFAEIPLAASFQPRWWMQIDLALDDTTSGPSLTAGSNP